jgi:hypothetical protein
MHFLARQVKANHAAINRLRLRQPIEELGSIKGGHASARPRHIANSFAHTHAGLVRLQTFLSD